MGAKKPSVSSSTKTAKSPTRAKTAPKATTGAKNTATKARSTPIKAADKTAATNQKNDEAKLTPAKANIAQKSVILPKSSLPKKPATTRPRSKSPKKSPVRQKVVEEKSKALNKIIKSLDIKCTGFKAPPVEEKIECKASISEIVKTKSRAASAKISPGPLGKCVKKDNEELKKTKATNSAAIVAEKPQSDETKDSKLVLDDKTSEKKLRSVEGVVEKLDNPKEDPAKSEKTDENKQRSQDETDGMKNKTTPDETKPKATKKPPPKKAQKSVSDIPKSTQKSKSPEKGKKKAPESAKKAEPKEKPTAAKKPPNEAEKKTKPAQKKPAKKKNAVSVEKPEAEAKAETENSQLVDATPSANKVDLEAITENTQESHPTPDVTSSETKTTEEPKSQPPKKATKSTPSTKSLSVRERLQKKYVGDKLSTFKAFKAKKQTDSTEKSPVKPTKSEDSRAISPSKKTSLTVASKQENDVYDFKTESESEDNIKMNLLVESSVLSKLGLSKGSKGKKIEDDIAEPDQKVKKKEQESETKPAPKKLAPKKTKEADKDFSEEDDQPLQQTKNKLDNSNKQNKQSDSETEKKTPVKIKEETKIEPKKSAKTGKTVKPKPPAAKKAPAPASKRKATRPDSSNSNSDDSENDDSDTTTSSSSSESLAAFGPKRHRMASLNALAKVQCLYENESRTAHELGLSKSAKTPKIRIIASGTSSDEEENAAKKLKKDGKDESVKAEKEGDSATETETTKRELRNAPGLRGMGKHWDFNEASSFESGHESDPTFRRDEKSKSKKRKIVKAKSAAAKGKEKAEAAKAKKAIPKTVKKKPRPPSSKESSDSSDDDDGDDSDDRNRRDNKKRKRGDDSEVKHVAITSKRMASLNASAIVAATYEVERHLDRNLDSDCSSFESILEEVKTESAKKALKEPVKVDPEEGTKESSRPTSSSVVIVQDTDVTITGVYVNSTTGSSQEAYCKMQYRVQSSVTEERVLRPSSIDPPKSYTPLSALSSMRPPGTDTGSAISVEDLSPQSQQTFQPTIVNREQPPSSLPMQQQQPNAHIHAQQYHPYSTAGPPPGQEQMHHMHSHPQSPQKYHHMHHHHHPSQPPPIAQPRCESPLRYASGPYHQNVQPPMPPPPNSIQISGGPSSAFCAPMQQSHHEISGYYQPAGPLISPHVLSTVPPANSSLVVSTKQISSPLDPERDQLQQLQQQQQQQQLHPSSASSGDSQDNDVLITGGDLSTFRYPSGQQQQQQQSLPQQSLSSLGAGQPTGPPPPPPPSHSSPYARSLHPMHYTTAYPPSYYSPYPGEAMCYSPPYQPYFPAKVYQSAPAYRRYSSYYQPGPPPPGDLYDVPPPQSAPGNPSQQPPPPQSAQQLVPTGPNGPQHIEHYPGPPGYYPNYNPGGGQCYARGMQPPYMEYQAPCPCPMQSCPKNVLTGPLIGSNNSGSSSSNTNNISNSSSSNNNNSMSNITASNTSNSSITTTNNSNSLNNLSQQLKTNKGPVIIHNHLMGQHEKQLPPPSSLPNGQSIHSQSHHHHHHIPCKMEPLEPLKTEIKTDVITDKRAGKETRKTGQYEETVLPPTPPSAYTVNDKLIEPDETVSPARGSAGLPTVPENAQESATQVIGLPVNGQSNPMEIESTNITTNVGRKARIGKSMAREMMYGAHGQPHHPIYNGHHASQHPHLPSHNPLSEVSKTVIPESIEPPMTIKSELDKIKKEPPIKIEDEDDVVILEQDLSAIKSEPDVVILDKSSDVELVEAGTEDAPIPAKRMKILDNKNNKKSSPNGYKSLIKQTEPKSYLSLSTKRSDRKGHFAKNSKLSSRCGIRKRRVALTEQQKKRLSIHKRNLMKLGKEQEELKKAAASKMQNKSGAARKASKTATFQEQKLPTDLANDTRGYFSEPEIRSTASRKTSKTRTNEARSRSETKKSQTTRVTTTTTTTIATTNGRSHGCNTKTVQMPKLPEDITNRKIQSTTAATASTKKTTSKMTAAAKKKSKTQTTAKDCHPTTEIIDLDPMTPRTMELDEPEILEEQNNNDTMVTENVAIFTTSTCRTSSCNAKRSRARGHRFSSKKRTKNRRYQTEVDNSIIPRKSNAVPKWNNGWSWCGEPFQAKVFLNSDDPLVIRTCYPAMRHIEGDVIRPRDCVLLRAGSKKNELPYVAKVAHLWENPEDGEMMMSLLWYYRPEHTEQGRQSTDCPDEVFASRHRDHNSVACIEDKCYVLTFSEYCRYRRRVRAVEEGIEDKNPIVPKLKTSYNISPKVPVTTNPEQVLFCQRVYEFRLKRLLKTPTN